MRRAQLGFIALILISACKVDPKANPHPTCTVDTDCTAGQRCYRGFCLPPLVTSDCTVEGSRFPCWTGPSDARGRGRCQDGFQECHDGHLGECTDQIFPAPEEICSTPDDDNCNGLVNEFEPICDTGMRGVCAPGHRDACGAPCVGNVGASPETCNDLDDDCNGEVDDRVVEECYPEGMTGCMLVDGSYQCKGVCRAGVRHCAHGAFGPCEGFMGPRSMTDGCTTTSTLAEDDDCDGLVDEDCVCAPGSTQPCYSGRAGTSTVGACHPGLQTCVDMGGDPHFGGCEHEQVPVPESCTNEGADDDCNGLPDDIPDRGRACTDTSTAGICQSGFLGCNGAAFGCVTTHARGETCNMLDDNCNGSTDEGFDLMNDHENCGRCGNACADSLTCCGGECVDLTNNNRHCGTCQSDCAGATCCSGRCEMTQTSTTHCGVCGRACAEGQTCCSGTCADTRTDEAHCNTCDTACASSLSCCQSMCAASGSSACMGCSPPCGPTETCCSGVCVDTMNNPAYCGSCTNTCSTGQVCCGGQCYANDHDHCGAACTNCGAGLCCSSSCVPRDAANCNMCGQVCGSGTSCCPDGCFDLSAEESHCGSCTNACGANQTCLSGLCCGPGLTNCSGMCVNLNTDEDNCGRCGHSCTLTACLGGSCI